MNKDRNGEEEEEEEREGGRGQREEERVVEVQRFGTKGQGGNGEVRVAERREEESRKSVYDEIYAVLYLLWQDDIGRADGR